MKLTKFAFGIRFTKGFHIEDQLGSIVDEILYSENSTFNEMFFPEVQRGDGVRRLINHTTNNCMTISVKDIIFEYFIVNDFGKELDTYLKEFNKTIIKKIFEEYKVRNIARLGFIVFAELDKEDSLLDEVKTSIKKKYKIDSEESLSIRFNIINKKPLKIGNEVTEDFDNMIITYDKPQMNRNIIMAVDYQKYFNPALNVIDDSPIQYVDFCKKCFGNYKNDYEQK